MTLSEFQSSFNECCQLRRNGYTITAKCLLETIEEAWIESNGTFPPYDRVRVSR